MDGQRDNTTLCAAVAADRFGDNLPNELGTGSRKIFSQTAASRLNSIDVEVNNVYSAYEAKAEWDSLLPDIEAALELLDDTGERPINSSTTKPAPLPVPVCSTVGNVLGSYHYHHKTLERLF